MKFAEVSEETQELFDSVLNETNLIHFMNIYYYAVPKQRGVIKVNKLNPLGEAVSQRPGTVVITVYEEVFEKLSPEQQKMLAEDAVNQILFDDEKDKITIEAPTIAMTIGGWKKYGAELANAYEIAVLAAQQIEEEKKAAKEASKNK